MLGMAFDCWKSNWDIGRTGLGEYTIDGVNLQCPNPHPYDHLSAKWGLRSIPPETVPFFFLSRKLPG